MVTQRYANRAMVTAGDFDAFTRGDQSLVPGDVDSPVFAAARNWISEPELRLSMDTCGVDIRREIHAWATSDGVVFRVCENGRAEVEVCVLPLDRMALSVLQLLSPPAGSLLGVSQIRLAVRELQHLTSEDPRTRRRALEAIQADRWFSIAFRAPESAGALIGSVGAAGVKLLLTGDEDQKVTLRPVPAAELFLRLAELPLLVGGGVVPAAVTDD